MTQKQAERTLAIGQAKDLLQLTDRHTEKRNPSVYATNGSVISATSSRWAVPLWPRAVSIVGPTASGKTSLAIALAARLEAAGQPCEIVNQDAYQMYRGMDIGTAKPSAKELAAIPHHLVNVVDPEDTMTVARFQFLARVCLANLNRRGVRPILVGGSGLYTRAAVDDISFAGHTAAIRAKLENRAKTDGPAALFRELQDRDPTAAAAMDPRNTRRTIRALEVIAVTGKPYSATLPAYRYVVPCIQIGLDLGRAELDARIDERTRRMRADGFVAEAARLRPRLSTTASRAIGYQQIFDFLDGVCTEDGAFEAIARKTRRLARKQMGWFGRDPRIHWLSATAVNLVDQAIELVELADAGKFDASDFGEVCPTVRHLGSV